MAYTLITAVTDAVATKAGFAVREVPATLFATGLAAAEECDIFISPDEGANWIALSGHDFAGGVEPKKLVATKISYEILTPMYIGVTKDATVAAAGVYLSDKNNI